MLKVKRSIQPPKDKDNVEKLQNEIKNAIKTLYIQNKKDTDVINQYSDTFQKVNNEYAIIYKENLELKKTIEELKKTSQHSNPPSYRYPPRKRPLSRYEYENDDEEHVQYIVRKKRKQPIKKIIYEEDLIEDDNDEIENDKKDEAQTEETIEKKTAKKVIKKSISKIIKM